MILVPWRREVPVYIRREDVAHMENVLKFKIAGEDGKIEIKGGKKLIYLNY